MTRILVSPIAYNTNLVKKEDAPKSFKDLLDPKWAGKMVKAHPAYSGTIMNATFQIARDLGWDYFEKLAKQKRHAGAVGDRHAEEDRSSANAPSWSTAPAISSSATRKRAARSRSSIRRRARRSRPARAWCSRRAPNPNAARLFQNWMHGREAQQFLVDWARQYSAHKQTVEKPERPAARATSS